MCQLIFRVDFWRALFCSSIAAFVILPITQLSADFIQITNSGFESDIVGDGLVSNSAISGWNKLGPVGVLNPNISHFTNGAAEGQNVANLGAAGSILFQDLIGESLSYGIYTFSFDVGNRLDQPLPELNFAFLVNAVTFIPLTSSNQPAVPEGEFRTWTFTYDVTNENVFANFLGDPLRIRFLSLDNATGGFVTVDNVRGSFRAVPEPSIACWIAMVIGVTWGWHRRRT